jgi:dTDP-4-amino-4,6-dideoxygalactose transaminase
MRIGKTLPPAASPISLFDIISGCSGLLFKKQIHSKLERSIKDDFDVKNCYFVSSGKAALTLTLEACSELFPERNEVIVPAFNCYSVPSAITRAGLKVIPCDILSETMQFDPFSLESILNKSSTILAIIPTHFFGIPSNIDAFIPTLKSKNIMIIEDAAQSMGGKYKGKYLGASFDAGIFSLSRGKSLSAGEGGIILTNNERLAAILDRKVLQLPSYTTKQLLHLIVQNFALLFLIHPLLYWIPKMLPFLKLGETIFETQFPIQKLSSFQMGMLNNWNTKLEYLTKKRLERITIFIELLSSVPNIKILVNPNIVEILSCIRLPILCESSDAAITMIKKSNKKGLGLSMTYPHSISKIAELNISTHTLFAKSEKATQTIVTLPCHSLMGKPDILKIVQIVKDSIQ